MPLLTVPNPRAVWNADRGLFCVRGMGWSSGHAGSSFSLTLVDNVLPTRG